MPRFGLLQHGAVSSRVVRAHTDAAGGVHVAIIEHALVASADGAGAVLCGCRAAGGGVAGSFGAAIGRAAGDVCPGDVRAVAKAIAIARTEKHKPSLERRVNPLARSGSGWPSTAGSGSGL